ncbi:MAG: M81 family metallopeptidase [Ilumatobacteraceae bacterium]
MPTSDSAIAPARPRRVAVVGYLHEANSLADPSTRAHARDYAAAEGGLAASWESGGAIARLRELRGDSVEIVTAPVVDFGAAGVLDGDDFRAVVAEAVGALRAAGPVDAVLVPGHGAGRTTDDLDPDGTFLRALRDTVGPDVPVVVVLDFHANVSAAMCEAADVIVGYRTNPHVDVVDRLREAADHVHRLLDRDPAVRRSGATVIARCAVPMVLPQVAQLTTPGEPLYDVMALAQSLIEPPLRNVSVFGGFSLGDVPDCGLTVTVSADEGGRLEALAVAEEVARAAWDRRERYRLRVVPVADAVERAVRAVAGIGRPVILADTSDNPGGGAPGNSTFVLEALRAARVRDTVMGLQCDPAVVDAAWAAGVGAHLRVVFNEGSTRSMARPLVVDAEVLSLVDAPLVPTKGVYSGALRRPGRCCALDLGGIGVAVSTHKVQCADDDTLLHVGLDPASARVVVVKSRGHFRAGFSHLFADDQVVEVGAPGVATNDLWGVEWQHLRRPVFPLDQIDGYVPEARLHVGRGGRVVPQPLMGSRP